MDREAYSFLLFFKEQEKKLLNCRVKKCDKNVMSLLKNETKTCRCGGSTGCCYFFAGNMLFIRHSLFINFLLVFPREPQCFSVLLILVLLLTLLAVLCSVLFFVLIFVNHAAARIIRDYDQKCMIKYWHHQN